MLRPHRALAVVLLLALGVACVSPDAEIVTNEILWDTWGVPHIRGESDEALFRGMGWAHMESRGDLMLKLYGEARGRASEYWGEEYLPFDQHAAGETRHAHLPVGKPACRNHAGGDGGEVAVEGVPGARLMR